MFKFAVQPILFFIQFKYGCLFEMICSLSEFWQESILANFVSFVHNETAEIFHDETFYVFFSLSLYRYTLVFLTYTFQLVFMMLLRPLISVKLCKNQGRNSIYAALYFLPVLVVLHAIFAGLLCECIWDIIWSMEAKINNVKLRFRQK